ncbi:DUF6003 family protein, partial [Streptomyces nigra]|uniref:DUF6003 family protein n=1 Tax=Streptomyces nigra TaxID=1827580 RepID=UPI00342DED63
MTEDAYLFLLDEDDPAAPLGVAPAAVGDLACMDTPAVRAWLDAQGVTATSPRLRLLPPRRGRRWWSARRPARRTGP